MSDPNISNDPVEKFLQRTDLSPDQALEAIRLQRNQNLESDAVTISRIKAEEERSKRSSWMSHPLTLALVTSLLTGGAVTAAFTFMSNRTTQFAETERQERLLANSLESTALEQKFRAFESLIQIDPEALLIQEEDQLDFSKRTEALRRERKQRICLSVAFGLIKVEPYMLPNLGQSHSEQDFANELRTFLDNEFDCLKDNGGFVPSTFSAPEQIANRQVEKTGQLSRIILHWTAGSYTVSPLDRKNAHEVIAGDGTRVPGVHPPEANLSPIEPGKYVAHTRNANVGSIGLAMAGMHRAQLSPFDPGPFPVTIAQVESLCNAIVDYARRYDISVSRETVLTHAEVEATLGIRQNYKWDITWLPGMDQPGDPIEVGDRLREMASTALAAPQSPNGLPVRCNFQEEVSLTDSE